MDENNPARMKYCLDLNLTLHKWDYISSLRSSCNICDFQAVHLGYIERKHKTGLSSINVHLTLSWMGGGRLCIFIDIYAIFFFDFLSKSLSCRSSRHNQAVTFSELGKPNKLNQFSFIDFLYLQNQSFPNIADI